MKTSMRHLGFILAACSVRAFAAETEPLPKISDHNGAAVAPSADVSQRINASLPKYDPQVAADAAADAAKAKAEPANSPNPDVLVLPKMVVKQKPRPRLTEDVVYKDKKDFGAIFAKKNYTQLDQALNKFTLPLFGTSLEARAYDDFQRQKNQQMQQDVNTISTALQAADPAAAKELRDAAAKQ